MAASRKSPAKKAAAKPAESKSKSASKAGVAKPRPVAKAEPKPKLKPRTHIPVGGGAPGLSRFGDRTEPVEEMPVPGKPMKAAVDAEWQSAIRDALARQRQVPDVLLAALCFHPQQTVGSGEML